MIFTWIALASIGLLTFATRLSFIVFLQNWQTPEWGKRILRFILPAVLSAIILPEMMIHSGQLAIWPINPRLIAGLAAIFVGYKTKNTILTTLVGMATLYLAEFLL